MPSTVKKLHKKPRTPRRKPAASKPADILAAPVTKPEPAYININERSAELAAKNRLLWIIVAVFSIILAIFWLIVLRANIARETDKIGLSQIGEQISASLARFDTEIKNRAAPKEITAEDMAAIRNGLEDQIKANPDSSTWPTHESRLGFSIQYPDGWTIDKTGGIISSNFNGGSGMISIRSRDNAKKYDLKTWLETNNKTDISGYSAQRQLFPVAGGSLESLIFNSVSTTSSLLDEIIYINSTSTKIIYQINLEAAGDIKYYRPIMEEIVRTIKIIK